MYEEQFSMWQRWSGRDQLARLASPGVYAIAHATHDMSGQAFSWRDEIVYIGMTNAASGLRGRLRQFDNTIAGKKGHGGADRVRFKHRDYASLCSCLYVSVAAFDCNPTSGMAADLRMMGEVARFEYMCFAHFVELYDKLPEFNDKKNAAKYSLTVGRSSETASLT
jgi:hypothetical protein